MEEEEEMKKNKKKEKKSTEIENAWKDEIPCGNHKRNKHALKASFKLPYTDTDTDTV